MGSVAHVSMTGTGQINSHLSVRFWDNLNQLKGDYQRGVEWENRWTFVRTNCKFGISCLEYSNALSIDEIGINLGGGWDATQHLYGVVDEVMFTNAR